MSKKNEVIDVASENKNLPVNIEDMIKKQLQEQNKQLGALPSNKIGLKNKVFTLPDGQSSPGPLECVVLDFSWFMVHYTGLYNAANPQKPNCFAVGRENPDSGLLAPHESVKKPLGKDCGSCAKNQWGSAATGKGKACKNQRRLILVPPNFTEDTEPMTLYVSPQGLKNWDKYASRLNAEHGALPVQVVTAISFDANQSYPLLQFKFVSRHTRVSEAWSLRERSQEILFRPLEIDNGKAA